MAFYAVDVRDRVIQRVTQEYNRVDNKRFFLIEAGSVKQAWAKAPPTRKGTSASTSTRSARLKKAAVSGGTSSSRDGAIAREGM